MGRCPDAVLLLEDHVGRGEQTESGGSSARQRPCRYRIGDAYAMVWGRLMVPLIRLPHVDGELHLRVNAALNDEVSGLFEDQGRLLAGLLIASVKCEPIGLDIGVMHGALVAVDEGDRIAATQEEVDEIEDAHTLALESHSHWGARAAAEAAQ